MSEDTTPKGPADKFASKGSTAPEIQVGGKAGLEVEVGLPGGKNKVTREKGDGLTADVDGKDAGAVREDDKLDLTPEEKAELGEEQSDTKEGEEPNKDGKESEEEKAPEALPEFDAAKEEVVKQYEGRFLAKDGTFNMEALTADWATNVKDGKAETGKLSEGTYKWLAARGIPESLVKEVEAGELAKVQLRAGSIFERAGGKDKFVVATAWAREGGYSKEAAAKFNAAVNGADPDARNDAIDLLMSRHGKAVREQKGRDVTGKRTTGDAGTPPGGGDGGGVQGYATHGEYRADFKKAVATNDQKLLNECRARLKVSKWYGGNKKG